MLFVPPFVEALQSVNTLAAGKRLEAGRRRCIGLCLAQAARPAPSAEAGGAVFMMIGVVIVAALVVTAG